MGAIAATPLDHDVSVPEMPRVDGRGDDEVGDVGRALGSVQDSALALAVDQTHLRRDMADSLGHLARRNQNLVVRQLDFLTSLEAGEVDSDRLAALFHLDHIATRVRRNAESLLVLAGAGTPRYRADAASVTDVVRAAMAEVEDYRRAQVTVIEPALVAGTVAIDLVHLLAELIETALAFSSRGTPVLLDGRWLDRAYRLSVRDDGYGMSPREIEQANTRLQGARDFTLAPSGHLGHYVTGGLAARHGIHVHLETAPGTGITAVVILPPGAVTSPARVLPDAETDPAS